MTLLTFDKVYSVYGESMAYVGTVAGFETFRTPDGRYYSFLAMDLDTLDIQEVQEAQEAPEAPATKRSKAGAKSDV
jgi:hypothetical protein